MTTVTQNQAAFDAKYITGSEICEQLQVSRASLLYARNKGILPDPVVIRGSGTYIWVRAEIVQNLEKWKHSLQIRRGELNVC